MTETQNGAWQEAARWAITAVLAVMAIRLVVAAVILAGKAFGAVEDGSLFERLQFNPLDIESPLKLAVNVAVVAVVASLFIASRNRREG